MLACGAARASPDASLRPAPSACAAALVQVVVLVRAAMEATDSDPVKAECFLYLARALHAKGAYQEASTYYAQVPPGSRAQGCRA